VTTSTLTTATTMTTVTTTTVTTTTITSSTTSVTVLCLGPGDTNTCPMGYMCKTTAGNGPGGYISFCEDVSIDRRLLVLSEAPRGSYCSSWDGGAEWCFVNGLVTCGDTSLVQGASTGPCTGEVESRSQFLVDGINRMSAAVLWAVLLGISLLVSSMCAGLMYFQLRDAWYGEDALSESDAEETLYESSPHRYQ
jgi:hypothetical protein